MGIKVIATNKQVYHNYQILETYEAGLVLKGTEVKALREGNVNMRDAYVRIEDGEAYVVGLYIGPYKPAGRLQHDPTRKRKLLLHKREILKLMGKIQEKGLTIVPTKIYFKNGKAKIEIALAKGKAKYEKREAIKERETKRELAKKYKGKIRL